jgi:uncharacterized protein YcbK (DUF882 family)
MKLSAHFSSEEFACHDGTPVPKELLPNAEFLCQAVLEVIRETIGRPVAVISGYRTKKHNDAVGGAARSSHLTAEGADIRAGDVDTLWRTILRLHEDGHLPGLGGVGRYDNWVHVDSKLAADGHLRMWGGRGIGSEKTEGG